VYVAPIKALAAEILVTSWQLLVVRYWLQVGYQSLVTIYWLVGASCQFLVGRY